jgi:hypothetical protein
MLPECAPARTLALPGYLVVARISSSTVRM